MILKDSFLQQFSGPSEHIPAMNRVKRLISEASFKVSNSSSSSNANNSSGAGGVRVFPLSMGYTQWETDEVIAKELVRNLGLAMGEEALKFLTLCSAILAFH